MSLDKNLFTLFLTPNTSHPSGTVVDLTDASGAIHYRKHRIVSESPQQQVYRIELCDPLSETVLASATAPSATSKHKTVELYNPSNVVELKYTGTLTFRWSFKWETHEFEWKREECFIIRKPDPPVLIAVTKEPPGRIRTSSVQILDYNLNRFDIEDRKGLEIVILTALMTFQDSSDAYLEPTSAATAATASPKTTGALSTASPSDVPKRPPKPAPKKGVERIAELQLDRGQVNEVTVLEEGKIADYAKHSVRLLQDDAMLFISIRSFDSDRVPKVLQVVEEIKRLRHKAGDSDLHQYVLYDTLGEGVTGQKVPRIINLDGDGKGKISSKEYTPPKNLTVHLSKIDMPELRPRGAPPERQPARHDHDYGKKKGKDTSRRGTEEKAPKDKDRHIKSKQISASPTNASTPRPPVPHKHRSAQHLLSSSSSSAIQSPPPLPPRWSRPPPPVSPSIPPVYYHAPPPVVPPRMSASVRPQTVYGNPYPVQQYYMYHNDNGGAVSGSTNTTGPLTSGLLGRFLGR